MSGLVAAVRRAVSELRERARAVLVRSREDRELAEELRTHLEMHAEENVRRGMGPEEARRHAVLDLGGLTQVMEATRDARGLRWLDDLVQDLRYGLRRIARSPGFALVAALTVALGIGATTAVFTLVNSVMFRPPPVAAPDRLVTLAERRGGMTSTTLGHHALPFERYLEYRDAAGDVFSGLAAYRFSDFSLRLDEGAVPVSGILASGNYFDVLGLRPAAGRFFAAADEPVAVLGHGFWRTRFGGDPAVVGRTVQLDSRPYTVVGVAPRGFGGTFVGIEAEVWVPYESYRFGAGGGFDDWVVPFGRLRPGLDATRAAAAIDAIAKAIPPEHPQTTVRGARLEPLTGPPAMVRGPVMNFFGVLFATAALVLLIAAANVAGMLIARSVARRREIAVRLAIGARRGRVVRQLLVESVLLFLVGGGGGILIAFLATRLFASIPLPTAARIVLDLSPDPRVLGFALALAAATGILFGLAPALRASRPDLVPALKDGARSGGGDRARGRSLFVAGQLALSVLLLVTAGLFVRSLRSGLALDPGLDPDGVVVATLDLAPHDYDEERGRALYAQLLERVRAIPDIENAGLAAIPLLTGMSTGGNVYAVDTGSGEPAWTNARQNVVDAAYFETLRVPLVAGRAFDATDRPGAPPVVVANQTLAARLWPGENPLGKRLRSGGQVYDVVGIARDGKYVTMGEAPRAFVFFPYEQEYSAAVTLHARTRGAAAEPLAQIRGAVRELDPNIAVEAAMPYPVLVDFSLFPQRFAAILVGVFGLVGLVLAAIGVYGVLAFQVAQRTREFGIRIALGAASRDVLRLVVGRGAVLAGVGALAGLTLAAAVTRFLQSFLFGVSPLDPVTFTGVPLVLALVAAVASYVPARKATRVQPMEALRAE